MNKKILLILASILIVISLTFVNAKFINTKQIKIKQVDIKSSLINEDTNDLIVCFFSDLHFGKYTNIDYLNKIVSKINDYDPDIIIFGGDLIDSSFNLNDNISASIIDCFNKLNPQYGKYAVLGEQDSNQDILTKSNFIILNNSNSLVKIKSTSINIVGLNCNNVDTITSFKDVNIANFTFVVSHYPDDFDLIKTNNFNYMLAGHSHSGEIYIPLISKLNAPTGCEKYFTGHKNIDGKLLDITNGVATSKNNARLFADNEIIMYRLRSK